LSAAVPTTISQGIIDAVAQGKFTYIDASTPGGIEYGDTGDLFVVSASNVTLSAKGGGSEFFINPGYGTVTISNTETSATGNNVLELGTCIDAANVQVLSDNSGDVILVLDAAGDEVVLSGMLAGAQNGVQSVAFSDGTVWTASDMLAQASSLPSGTYVLARGA